MNICVIGTGYVGLVTGACLAEFGMTLICVDNDHQKIDLLEAGESARSTNRGWKTSWRRI